MHMHHAPANWFRRQTKSVSGDLIYLSPQMGFSSRKLNKKSHVEIFYFMCLLMSLQLYKPDFVL